MTADIAIVTDEQKNVLHVPTRSILSDGQRTYVRLLTPEGVRERDIVVGLRGSEGTSSIASGLSEGDEVIVFVIESE
jgi:multidrug efflux pump subunit AcrA (membrane-fusion protein)